MVQSEAEGKVSDCNLEYSNKETCGSITNWACVF